MRRRLAASMLGAVLVLGLTACYQRVVRDDRIGGESEVFEPSRRPDLIDEIEQGLEAGERARSQERRRPGSVTPP